MELKALTKFRDRDFVRGQMVERKTGEFFEHDEHEHGQDILSGIHAERMTVTDERFIPKQGIYVALHAYACRGLVLSPGREISLSQEDACFLMAKNIVKPKDEKQWRVTDLLGGDMVRQSVAKIMFDDTPGPKQESWIRRALRGE